MSPEDIASIARNAVAIYSGAIEQHLPAEHAELAAIAHCVAHWPITSTGEVRAPTRCATPGCYSLSYAILDDHGGASHACIRCMLDQTQETARPKVTSMTGDRINVSDTN